MIFLKLLQFEIKHSLRRYNDLTAPIWLLILIVFIFSLSFQQNTLLSQQAAAGIIWAGTLLSMMLSIHQLFTHDYHSGSLEHMLLSPTPSSAVIGAKLIAYWLKTCLPFILLTPLIGSFFQLPLSQIKPLLISLLIGTPTLTLLGALSAALTLKLRNNTLLLALLTLPLCLPILIFGLSISHYAHLGLTVVSPVCFLLAMCLISLIILPMAITSSLKVGISS